VNADLYALLELDAHASAAEIRAAFRRLAQVHHPDRPTGSAERMAAINRAYAVLGDPDRRRRYDQALTPLPAPAAPEPAADAPAWLIDLEHGHDLDDWRQMFAEERHLWEQLLAAQPHQPAARADIEAALDRARADQLALENAIRARAGLAPITLADLDRDRMEGERAQQVASVRAGCLTLLLPWR
jgi:curved DNA-binding protein CbpA